MKQNETKLCMSLSEGPNIWINAKLITIMHYGLLMVTDDGD